MLDKIAVDTCLVDQAIVHPVDNKKDALTLAVEAQALTPELQQFIVRHIAECLPRCHAGVFENRDQNTVSLACEAIVSSEIELIAQSQQLARHLFGYMRPQNIKGGTLWVVVFRPEPTASRHVGLMKMDDTTAFTYREVGSPEGQRVEIDIHQRGLPHVKIDKAAFILPRGKGDLPYELRFLDAIGGRRGVAKFFQSFLGCQPLQDDREKTNLFTRQFETWVQKKREELPETLPEQQLREFKQTTLRNNTVIHIEEFAAAALGDQNPELQEDLVKHFRENKLHDPEFTVDMPRRSSSKVVFRFTRGQHKVEVAGAFDAIRALVEVKDPTAEHPYYHVVIEADQFEEVPR